MGDLIVGEQASRGKIKTALPQPDRLRAGERPNHPPLQIGGL
jgi:hypothetical protein